MTGLKPIKNTKEKQVLEEISTDYVKRGLDTEFINVISIRRNNGFYDVDVIVKEYGTYHITTLPHPIAYFKCLSDNVRIMFARKCKYGENKTYEFSKFKEIKD